MNEKQSITVGNCTMSAITVPVRIILDFLDAKKMVPDTLSEHFRLIETDGYFIVSLETFFHLKPSKIEYKCFIEEEDAFEYLTLYGVYIGKEKECEWH